MASCKIQESKRKARRSMNDTLWDRVCGLGSEIWKGCNLVELLVFLKSLVILEEFEKFSSCVDYFISSLVKLFYETGFVVGSVIQNVLVRPMQELSPETHA